MRTVLFWIWLAVLTIADEGYAHRLPYDMSRLQLSASQHRAVKEALVQYRKGRKVLHKQEERLEASFRTMFLSARFDAARYRRLVLALKRQEIALHAELLDKLHRILTPAQRRMFARYLEEWDDE